MTVAVTIWSIEELAKSSIDRTAIVLVVGSRNDCEPLVARLSDLVLETERIVHVEPDARIFDAMEKPKGTPAIGVWSAKGSLIGYRDGDESTEEFLAYARRYC